jgi:hypothetical protein
MAPSVSFLVLSNATGCPATQDGCRHSRRLPRAESQIRTLRARRHEPGPSRKLSEGRRACACATNWHTRVTAGTGNRHKPAAFLFQLAGSVPARFLQYDFAEPRATRQHDSRSHSYR